MRTAARQHSTMRRARRRGRGRRPCGRGAAELADAYRRATAARGTRSRRGWPPRRARQVVDDAVGDGVATSAARGDLDGAHPVGGVRAARASRRTDLPSTPSGKRFIVTRAVREVGEHDRSDPRVVVDDLALGEARSRDRAPCRGCDSDERAAVDLVVTGSSGLTDDVLRLLVERGVPRHDRMAEAPVRVHSRKRTSPTTRAGSPRWRLPPRPPRVKRLVEGRIGVRAGPQDRAVRPCA